MRIEPGKIAADDLADVADFRPKVVELQMCALRAFEDDRIARRRDALARRRGKDQERDLLDVNQRRMRAVRLSSGRGDD